MEEARGATRRASYALSVSRPIVFAALATGPQRLELEGGALYPPLPPATYSALRSYGGVRFLRLADHLERTRGSMQRLGWEHTLDEGALRQTIDGCARAHAQERGGECKLRFDVYAAPIELSGVETDTLVVAEALPELPSAFRAEGVRLTVTRELAREQPLVKNAAWVRERAPYLLQTQGAFDALMVDADNQVREGSTCNFFARIDGELITASSGVLEGVTRRVVLELCSQHGHAAQQRELALSELARASEAFLTSSSRHLVPVVAVGDTRIGDGEPGELTRELARAYDEYARQRAEPA